MATGYLQIVPTEPHGRIWRPDLRFLQRVETKELSSVLEIPNGRDKIQNARLTITIGYKLDFLDGNNLSPGFVYLKGNKAYAKDWDGRNANSTKEFPLRYWDDKSKANFEKRFLKAAEFWNKKFLLVMPQDYNQLNYGTPAGDWVVHPNVICLFRLLSAWSPTHLRIKVVRPVPSDDEFRSDSWHYTETDVKGTTVWHELGHALRQEHIRTLTGDAQCSVGVRADAQVRCYDGPNIMGSGKKLEPVNAKAWRALMWLHTGIHENRWRVANSVNEPPQMVAMPWAAAVMPREPGWPLPR